MGVPKVKSKAVVLTTNTFELEAIDEQKGKEVQV